MRCRFPRIGSRVVPSVRLVRGNARSVDRSPARPRRRSTLNHCSSLDPAKHEEVPLFYAPSGDEMMHPDEICRAIYRSYVAIYQGAPGWQECVDSLEAASAALDARSRPWWADVWV
jgi:hypothetical protein